MSHEVCRADTPCSLSGKKTLLHSIKSRSWILRCLKTPILDRKSYGSRDRGSGCKRGLQIFIFVFLLEAYIISTLLQNRPSGTQGGDCRPASLRRLSYIESEALIIVSSGSVTMAQLAVDEDTSRRCHSRALVH